MASPTQWFEQALGDSEGQRSLACCRLWGHKESDMTLQTNVRLVKAMVFPVVMYGCTVKKAECRGIDAFELWCWRKLLRIPWTARRSN